MNLLALETSTRRLSVALWRDGDLIERGEELPNGGSERLLPWVNELLRDAGLTLNSLDGIAFGAGPGSFTGLRLAAGCAQGLAYGLDLPVLGVCTLEALALQSGEWKALPDDAALCGKAASRFAGPAFGCPSAFGLVQPLPPRGPRNTWGGPACFLKVFACLDARMNEVYSAAYAGGVEVLPPSVGPAGSVAVPSGEGWTGCGDGFAVHGDALAARLGGSLIACRPDVFPTAAAVARLAAPRLARGEGVGAAFAAPLYVRDKVALTTVERLARGGVR
ncbi:MAG: tRNA (adenosine(37)-N6)-threonylcarbamoyltransferase complex dimerization subunit type 1 TsaB [Rhodocyclaceae bacterium]|nr:tRNA (adenosine(37)-N6)-threonylcarbamoyltransferase complex dimerization subunit type 1 TsaB [Rhodocyclaceae bacterium]